MNIAIYARKSKTSDKGDSIENQITCCKEYIYRSSLVPREDLDFILYKDDGFSGSTLERPQFKSLLKDAQRGLFHMLICYRLDRVSRNIADFSKTYELLQEKHIEFVSVKEQFDTSTPIGRAMLNIAMVFAQLERETIAERIRDNMQALAKTGRWLGGQTPTGFIATPIEYFDAHMNPKKMFKLTPKPSEIEKVLILFEAFLELKSLRAVESFLRMKGIYSKKNCKYTASTIKDILINPVYAAADAATYTYFSSLGCELCNTKEAFNGKYGLMPYNRTHQLGKRIHTAPSNWIIAIGNHPPTIQGATWVHIQSLLKKNAHKSFYTKKTMDYALLTNLIECKHCGATMKVKKGKEKSDGTLAYTYVCSTKEASRRSKCSVKNIIGQDADQEICKQLRQLCKKEMRKMEALSTDEVAFYGALNNAQSPLKTLKAKLAANQKAIKNLLRQLSSLDENSPLCTHFIEELETLDQQNHLLKEELKAANLSSSCKEAVGFTSDKIRHFLDTIDFFSSTEDLSMQRLYLRSLIEKITWDGEKLTVHLLGKKKEEGN